MRFIPKLIVLIFILVVTAQAFAVSSKRKALIGTDLGAKVVLTSTTTGSPFCPNEEASDFQFFLNVTKNSGTISLIAKIQDSNGDGNWRDLATFETLTDTGTEVLAPAGPYGACLRAVMTISGSSPNLSANLMAEYRHRQ